MREKTPKPKRPSTKIEADYQICFGAPRLVAARYPVAVIIHALAAEGADQVISGYGVTREQVWACVDYAEKCIEASGQARECEAFWKGIEAGKRWAKVKTPRPRKARR